MNYSKTHQEFARRLDNQDALTDPEQYLGPNYRTVLDFWWYLEGLSKDQLNEVARRYREIPDAAWSAAWYAAGAAARDAAGAAARDAARDTARDTARDADWSAAGSAAWDATLELIGMHDILKLGLTLEYIPLFEFKLPFHKRVLKKLKTFIKNRF